jgi:plastocyanin
VLKSITIDPMPSGTLLGLGDPAVTLFTTALDENDQPIPGVAVSVVTLDPNKLTLFAFGGPPAAQPNALGKARVVASTTSYGITKTDTLEFTIQYGMAGNVTAYNMLPTAPITFSPSAVLIGVGGTVRWFNSGNGPVGITFNNGIDHIVGGNIPSIGVFQSDTRQFTAAGTYTYTETGSGSTGTVIVREQPTF